MTAVEIADPVFMAGAAMLGTLLIAAVSWTASALVKATTLLEKLDGDHKALRVEHDNLERKVLAHFDAEKDRRIAELEMELAKVKGLAG